MRDLDVRLFGALRPHGPHPTAKHPQPHHQHASVPESNSLFQVFILQVLVNLFFFVISKLLVSLFG